MPETAKKIRLKDHHRILIALVFNLAVCLICAFVLVPEAMNNDDYIIHSITSGAFGKFSYGLGHTNVIYGKVLVALQRAMSDLNWFELLNYAMLFFATFLVSCMIWLRNRNPAGFLLSLSFSLFIGPYFYNQLHNSKEIPYIAAAALFAVLFGVEEKRYAWCFAGGLLALLASWVRFHAFLLGAAFVFGAAVLFMIRIFREEKKKGASLVRLVGVFLLVFALIFGTYYYDLNVESRDESLKNYRQYNAARGAVSDYDLPDYSTYFAEYQKLGISENDYAMIVNWDFADSEKFPAQLLNEIAALRPPVPFVNAAGRMLAEIGRGLITDPLEIAFLVLFFVFLAFTRRTEKMKVVWMGLALAVCYLYMCLTGRTTRWVTAGLFGAGITGLFLSVRWKKGDLAKICALALLLAVLLFDVVSLVPEIGDYSGYFNTAAAQVYRDLGTRKDDLYLMDHSSAPALQRVVPTFSSVEPNLFRNVFVLGGWDTESSAKNSVLERYSVYGSPYRALVEKRNVYLADTKNSAMILKFIRENYAPSATMALQETVDGYSIFAFTNQKIETDDASFEILDAAASIDEQFGAYVYVGAVFGAQVSEGDTVYIELTDREGKRTVYRAHSLEREDGNSAAVMWIPLVDVPELDGLSFRVILEGKDGALRGSAVFDSAMQAE